MGKLNPFSAPDHYDISPLKALKYLIYLKIRYSNSNIIDSTYNSGQRFEPRGISYFLGCDHPGYPDDRAKQISNNIVKK